MPAGVQRFGTGYQVTTVQAREDGTVLWTREPGVDSTEPFAAPTAELLDAVGRVDLPDVELVLPAGVSDAEVTWTTDGDLPAGEVVRLDPASEVSRHVVGALARAMGRLHAGSPSLPDTVAHRPRGLVRHLRWMEGGRGPRASGPWRSHLRRHLGARRWDLLHESTRSLLAARPGRHVVLHGWMSLGNVVLRRGPASERPRRVQVLTGPDAAEGAPEVDLGCLVGELAEFEGLARQEGRDPLPFAHLAALATSLYERHADPELLDRARVVRVALHSRDFASFVGWHEDLERYAPLVADLLDEIDG